LLAVASERTSRKHRRGSVPDESRLQTREGSLLCAAFFGQFSALGFVLVTGSGANALNFCFNPGTLTNKSLAVAERFKRPGKGSCSPIDGFDLATEATGLQLVTGTACLNSTGDTMRVAYTVRCRPVRGLWYVAASPGELDHAVSIAGESPRAGFELAQR
jgi:hypothetical protein